MSNLTTHKKNEDKNIKICTFWIEDRLFGIDILDIKEVDAEIGFTKIYHASEKVKGYVNIRGNIYLIIDLRVMLGYESKMLNSKSRIILFKPSVGETFGILVDQVGEVVEIINSQIEYRHTKNEFSPSSAGSAEGVLSAGVCQLDKNLLVVIEARQILNLI